MEKAEKTSERLDKVLSNNGFGTRKDTRKLIRSGAVTVNGETERVPDVHVNIAVDKICVEGDEVQILRHVYLMMNKEAGCVCSTRSDRRKTIYDYLEPKYLGKFLGGTISSIGRLDADTEGLLLLTTDGALNHNLTSPKNKVPKVYLVTLAQSVDAEEQERYTKKLNTGIHIEAEGKEAAADCLPAEVNWLSETECELTICEGKFHEVKRMFAALGNAVAHLKRLSMNGLTLDPSLPGGGYRELTQEELEMISKY